MPAACAGAVATAPAVIIAAVCGIVLNTVQEPVDKAFTSASSVRLGA